MPSYNLTQTQTKIVVSWLYEPNGYLDFAVRSSDEQTARQALTEEPGLDVTQWIRDNPQQDPVTSNEVAMVWWIRENDQVNIPTPQLPPEKEPWAAILHAWDASIDAGFGRVPQNQRESNTVPLFDENGEPAGTMPAGSHLSQQQQMINKVLAVME